MERGSIQHGARLDDELADGVDALVTGAPISARDREELDPEAPAAAEIDLDAEAEHDAVTDRSELARWLLPSTFPGGAAALVAGALAQQAPDRVVATLRSLDPAAEFHTVGDVWVALRSRHGDPWVSGPGRRVDARALRAARARGSGAAGRDRPGTGPGR